MTIDRQGSDQQYAARSLDSQSWKLAIAFSLFAVAGWLVYARRADWAEVLCALPGTLQGTSPSPSPPDFDLENARIPKEEIRRGGPPKDGIPALTNPRTITARQADYLDPGDRVAGVTINGASRAYPLRILNWHEIVNDTVGGVPIAVTYCPLCDSVAVFDRRTPEGVKEFGVSGLLYNSNVLMYDRGGKPEALWTQLGRQSVTGSRPGTALATLPVELTTWESWSARYPKTDVLSQATGHARRYEVDPYSGYFDQPDLMFPVAHTDERLPTKERILGVWLPDGTAKAYPLSAFSKAKEPMEVRDTIGDEPITLRYDPSARSLAVTAAPEQAGWMYSLWFAWAAFHPESAIYEAP